MTSANRHNKRKLAIQLVKLQKQINKKLNQNGQTTTTTGNEKKTLQ